MVQISLIGRVITTPEKQFSSGRPEMVFNLRAENSPQELPRTSCDYMVCSTSTKLLDSLQVGTSVYISGLLRIVPGSEPQIRALILKVTEKDELDDEFLIDRLYGQIPLSGI